MMKLREKDPDFISVVLLLRTPVRATQALIEQAVERAWPANPGSKKSEQFVVMQRHQIEDWLYSAAWKAIGGFGAPKDRKGLSEQRENLFSGAQRQ